jgi:uncharacterized protein YecE (DUF72 family)
VQEGVAAAGQVPAAAVDFALEHLLPQGDAARLAHGHDQPPQCGMHIHIGTSGFLYRHWNNGVFYPRGVKDRLAYASERFTAIEINSSFYRIPPPDTVAGWAAVLPAGVKMVLKAPQSVSHRRRLKLASPGSARQGAELLAYFIEGVLRIPLEKRGPALLQLPPAMEAQPDRLQAVLELFAVSGIPVALEVRHASWFADPVLALLERYGSALAWSDWPDFTPPPVVTADFVYLRRHGPGALFASAYEDAALRADLELLRGLAVESAYVFFNNDIHGHAPRDAMRMMAMLGESGIAGKVPDMA